MLVCCGLVLLMVILGGVTRLTQSGLSMVEWQPLSILPPLSEAQWQDTFAHYQQFPEFRLKNAHMTLEGFKSIFWLEYIHRLVGRVVGAVFLVPFLWFVATRRIDRRLGGKLAGLFLLGAMQGVMGWFMVKSGLIERPDVSPYRLTAHLGLALLIYGLMLWTALGILWERQTVARAVRSFARAAKGVLALLVVTILSGGFVAGLDAGMTYNTFPLMDGQWIPEGLMVMDPWYMNPFENIATVQFQHRWLAMTTMAAVWMVWGWSRFLPAVGSVRTLMTLFAVMAGVQGGLGIATLVLVVPVPLAATHQAGAFILLTLGLVTIHQLHISHDSRHAKGMPSA